MRKRLMNISKRCMVAIMSAAFIMSSVTVSMAFPVGVYAEELPDNPLGTTKDKINIGDTMEYNYGTVNENNGTIDNNIGIVTLNRSTIDVNEGRVGENWFRLKTNEGSVDNNGAILGTNYGTIGVNDSEANVGINYGTVSHNQGEIGSNFDGTVTNEGEGHILNQYYSVTLSNTSNMTAEYGTGFTEQTVDKAGNKKQFIQVKEDGQERGDDASGLITISPKENYKITGHDTEEVTQSSDSTFYYELREDGGKYYLTIINPTKALTIDPTTLGLVISRIQNKENVSIANVIFEDLVYTYDSTNDGDQSEPSGNVTPVIMNTTERMFAGKNTYLHNGVYEMYYRSQSNLTWKEFDLLCSTDSNIPKNCYFTIGGRLYVLHIPAIDTGSETYKSCLDELKKRPNGLEGPAKIAEIFNSLGVTCIDLTANQPEAKETRIASTDNRSAVNPFGANTMDQIVTQATAANELEIRIEISSLPATGGEVSVPDLAQTGLSKNVVDAIIEKNAPIMLIYTTGGIKYQMEIPAGFNLMTLSNENGGIDFATLRDEFDSRIVVQS